MRTEKVEFQIIRGCAPPLSNQNRGEATEKGVGVWVRYLEVVAAVEISRHAEVPDLDLEALSDEAVACGQVAVYEAK